MKTTIKPTIAKPNPNLFTSPHSIVREKIPVPIVERIDDSGRILRFVKGAPHPNKGFPFPEAVTMGDVAKKMLRSSFRWYSPRKSLIRYASYTYPWLKPYELEINHMTEASEAVLRVGTAICKILNLPDSLAHIGSYIIQYDNAWRLIFEDVMTESKQENWANPRKEVLRLLRIMDSRFPKEMIKYHRQIRVLKLLTVTLLFPKVRSAISTCMTSFKGFSMFQLDDADRYWASLRDSYYFFGLPVEQRYPSNPPEFVLL